VLSIHAIAIEDIERSAHGSMYCMLVCQHSHDDVFGTIEQWFWLIYIAFLPSMRERSVEWLVNCAVA